ncbi:cation-transporting P-type ATPase [Lacrimispora xylanisolvens]|uniref:cation-transporting P-type ATPase n=1 Tax=Lacrimispora xylanisolvens TaxID=384636 RepID=UPI0032E7F7ED
MQEFLESKQELIKRLGSDETTGLSTSHAEKNREQYGTNVLTREKPESLFKRILSASSEPMILMLIMAGVIALIVNIIRATTGSEADFLECVGIFAAIFLSVLITVVMEGKKCQSI